MYNLDYFNKRKKPIRRSLFKKRRNYSCQQTKYKTPYRYRSYAPSRHSLRYNGYSPTSYSSRTRSIAALRSSQRSHFKKLGSRPFSGPPTLGQHLISQAPYLKDMEKYAREKVITGLSALDQGATRAVNRALYTAALLQSSRFINSLRG